MHVGMKFLWVLAVWGVNDVLCYMSYNIPKKNIRKRFLYDFDTASEYRVMVPRHAKRIVLELYDNNNPQFGQNTEAFLPSPDTFPSLYDLLYGGLSDLSARNFGRNFPYPFYQQFGQQMNALQKQNIKPYSVEMGRNMPHIILNTTEILPEERGKTHENGQVNVKKVYDEFEEKAAQPSLRVDTITSSKNVHPKQNSISSFSPFIAKRFYDQHSSNVPHNLEQKNHSESEYLSRLFVNQNNVASSGTKIPCNKNAKPTNFDLKENNPIYRSDKKEADSFETEEKVLKAA